MRCRFDESIWAAGFLRCISFNRMHTLLDSGHTSPDSIHIDGALLHYNDPHRLCMLSYILLLRHEVTFERLRKVLGCKFPMEV